MRRTLFIVAMACAAFLARAWSPLHHSAFVFGPVPSHAAEDWKAEFDAVCSKTDTAMTLSVDELKELVARCDQLRPKIEAQEETTRKVYVRRLQM
ncbi:MAG: hypothetical protein ACM3L8_09095, partial [Verrucomicrobiota bacterium]